MGHVTYVYPPTNDVLNGMSTEESTTGKPVVVVGGGLVGSLQAIFLAKNGYHVHLYDQRKDIRKFDPGAGRSINLALSHRGRQALKAIGCEERVVASAIPMHARMIHSYNGRMSSQPYGTNRQAILSIDRQKLNELLITEAENHQNIDVIFEHKLLRADLDTQVLTFAHGGIIEKQVEAQFIFGCDGAYSTVRRQMMRWGRLNYHQEYIEHGYKELTMPPREDGMFAMPENFLHIWPRNEFMMIALPNQNRSFTLTLFMPFKTFESIETEEDVLAFFMKHFPDSIKNIGADRLLKDYFANPTGSLMSVKCFPHYLGSNTLILGDAAHAVVPFYGQGMNAGFEDCLVFDECLSVTGNNLHKAAKIYSETRWVDTHAIADLSMYNYLEMRSFVNSKIFVLQKYVDNILHRIFPRTFIPLYTMVAFTRIPYHEAVERDRWQRGIVNNTLKILGFGSIGTGILVALVLASNRH